MILSGPNPTGENRINTSAHLREQVRRRRCRKPTNPIKCDLFVWGERARGKKLIDKRKIKRIHMHISMAKGFTS